MYDIENEIEIYFIHHKNTIKAHYMHIHNIHNTMWIKKHTISLVIISEKLVQILLEFRQQIVEGYKVVLAKFCRKRPFQSTKLCDLKETSGRFVDFPI